jgi:hypothetical protein
MKKERKARSVMFPVWMSCAIADLAIRNNRSVNGEIVSLVEAALKDEGFDRNRAMAEEAAYEKAIDDGYGTDQTSV